MIIRLYTPDSLGRGHRSRRPTKNKPTENRHLNLRHCRIESTRDQRGCQQDRAQHSGQGWEQYWHRCNVGSITWYLDSYGVIGVSEPQRLRDLAIHCNAAARSARDIRSRSEKLEHVRRIHTMAEERRGCSGARRVYSQAAKIIWA